MKVVCIIPVNWLIDKLQLTELKNELNWKVYMPPLNVADYRETGAERDAGFVRNSILAVLSFSKQTIQIGSTEGPRKK